jgi:hypothetical protein
MAVFEYYMEGRGAERIYWFFLPFMLSNAGTKLNVILLIMSSILV